MSAPSHPAPAVSPYASSPGGSIPTAGTDRAEGTRDLWSFFWVAILSTLIIAVAGLAAWWYVHL